ncbi:MAG: DUF4783 domain-containing protein [Bacteroidales bacterium]|nr:DUF4783 domain-containing protein [Bacteroidales bacterium]
MRKFLCILMAALLAISASPAQNKDQDVFIPISKYLQAGDHVKLSAWFADNMELDLLGSVNNCSRNQARLIMKDFFDTYTPRQFTILHKGNNAPARYAIGTLVDAGGEKFRIIIHVKSINGKSYIQQLRIERE